MTDSAAAVQLTLNDLVNEYVHNRSSTIVYNVTEHESPTSTPKLIMVSIYSILLAVGMLGNVWAVLSALFHLQKPQCERRHLLMYVLTLSIVDTLCLAFLPLIIANMVSPFWSFGVVACVALFCFESPNKLLSTFLLVALSANCYVSVCHPTSYRQWQRRRYSFAIVVLSAFVSVLLMTPVYMYTNVFVAGEFHDASNTFVVRQQECGFLPPDEETQTIFIVVTFVVAFCMTSFAQVGFYGVMLAKLFAHRTKTKTEGRIRSRIPLGKVSKTVMLLVSVYILCWLPYWVVQLCQVVLSDHIPLVLHLAVHTLPYFNAAINPTLYLRLSRQNSSSNDASLGVYIQRTVQRRISAVTVATDGTFRRKSTALRNVLVGILELRKSVVANRSAYVGDASPTGTPTSGPFHSDSSDDGFEDSKDETMRLETVFEESDNERRYISAESIYIDSVCCRDDEDTVL